MRGLFRIWGRRMDLTVRTSHSGDLAEVDALFSASYPRLLARDYAPSVLVTALPLISRAQPDLLSSGRYYVALDEGGAIRGAGGWSLREPGSDRASARTGHVRHVVTDHRITRRGVGRAILDRVVADARTAGLARMDCFSTLTAVPFYEAVGFRVVEPVTIALRPGIDFPAVRMRRQL